MAATTLLQEFHLMSYIPKVVSPESSALSEIFISYKDVTEMKNTLPIEACLEMPQHLKVCLILKYRRIRKLCNYVNFYEIA